MPNELWSLWTYFTTNKTNKMVELEMPLDQEQTACFKTNSNLDIMMTKSEVNSPNVSKL